MLAAGIAILALAYTPSQASAQGPYKFQNVVIGGGGGFITGIVFSPTTPGVVYARTDIGGAYRFDPESGRWVPLLDWIGYPDWNLTGVESIAIDPKNPRRIYAVAGTYSNDWTSQNGAILRSDNDDQHQYGLNIAAITGDPRVYGRVYFATNGRGIIYGDPVPSTH